MHEEIKAVYDMLWNTCFAEVARGDVEIDPYLTHPGSDQRRGLTLIFRPAPALTELVLAFLDEMRVLEPQQYFYNETNLHFTVLPLFTATPHYQPEYRRLADYENAVQNAVKDAPAFSMQISGLTISRGAVIVCGWPSSDTLNTIRQRLRRNLIQMDLAQGLDKRYTLVAAHTTVLRFAAPLQNAESFSRFLAANRTRNFGAFEVETLQLVKNDWYMSQQHTPVIAEYELHKP